MKRLIEALIATLFVTILALSCMVTNGCKTADTVAYRTIGSAVQLVDTTMKVWGEYVRAGFATEADEARVKAAYQKYQLYMSSLKDSIEQYKQGFQSKEQLQEATAKASSSAESIITIINAIKAKKVEALNG